MSQNEAIKGLLDSNRREFIKGASASSLMLLMGGVPLIAEDAKTEAPKETHYSSEAAPVSCAVIGCGLWGREILDTLALIPAAPVLAICDSYKKALTRAQSHAPKAEAIEDYRKILELKSVQSVIVATPSHLHREVVEAALKAGKHVYCEAPLATTIDDARAIARAAYADPKLNFQTGLQTRSDPQKTHVLSFMRNGAVGKPVLTRAQWHKKESWRSSAPNPEREKAINWRLNRATSGGLVGEIGIHQIDLMNWFLNKLPESVNGFGTIMNWDDGRDVPDTVQSILHYPGKLNFMYEATLCNSFDEDYAMIYGINAAVLMRDSKAWLFQEADSPLLGWEIYASKEQFGKQSGISLAADASHSVKNAKDAPASQYADSALHHALKAFAYNCGRTDKDVKNFIEQYGEDPDGMRENFSQKSNLAGRSAAAGYREGFEATVCAIKTNEAILKGGNEMLPAELFKIEA